MWSVYVSSIDDDCVLQALDIHAHPLYTSLFGSTRHDVAFSVSLSSNGLLFISGWVSSAFDGQVFQGNEDVMLVMYNTTTSTRVWTKLFGSDSVCRGYDVKTFSTNVYQVGFCKKGSDDYLNGQAFIGSNDAFILSRDGDSGSLLQFRLFGTPGSDLIRALDVINNVVAIAGITTGNLNGNLNVGGTDVFISLVNNVPGNNFTFIWTTTLSSSSDDHARDIIFNSNNRILICGYTESTTTFESIVTPSTVSNNGFIATYDINGVRKWLIMEGNMVFRRLFFHHNTNTTWVCGYVSNTSSLLIEQRSVFDGSLLFRYTNASLARANGFSVSNDGDILYITGLDYVASFMLTCDPYHYWDPNRLSCHPCPLNSYVPSLIKHQETFCTLQCLSSYGFFYNAMCLPWCASNEYFNNIECSACAHGKYVDHIYHNQTECIYSGCVSVNKLGVYYNYNENEYHHCDGPNDFKRLETCTINGWTNSCLDRIDIIRLFVIVMVSCTVFTYIISLCMFIVNEGCNKMSQAKMWLFITISIGDIVSDALYFLYSDMYSNFIRTLCLLFLCLPLVPPILLWIHAIYLNHNRVFTLDHYHRLEYVVFEVIAIVFRCVIGLFLFVLSWASRSISYTAVAKVIYHIQGFLPLISISDDDDDDDDDDDGNQQATVSNSEIMMMSLSRPRQIQTSAYNWVTEFIDPSMLDVEQWNDITLERLRSWKRIDYDLITVIINEDDNDDVDANEIRSCIYEAAITSGGVEYDACTWARQLPYSEALTDPDRLRGLSVSEIHNDTFRLRGLIDPRLSKDKRTSILKRLRHDAAAYEKQKQQPTPWVNIACFNSCVIGELALESIPQLIIQIINASLLHKETATLFAISICFSGYMIIRLIYALFYQILWKKQDICSLRLF